MIPDAFQYLHWERIIIHYQTLAIETKRLQPTMHWQKTGLDQQTSAVVRYQLWFGPGPLRLIF